ncbi:MAG TPA: hypothetical protein VF804_15400 [Holophagaceae bacterium]
MSKSLLPCAFLLLGLACGAPKAPVPTAPPQPFTPTLVLRPTVVALIPGATQAFQAEINYPEGVQPLRQPVKWSVIESDGGTITPSGVYTAPARYGTFHVEAQREDFPGKRVAATVVVR